MQLNKYLAIAAISAATLASAQSSSSLFDVVTAPNNTLEISKFVALLSSDEGYKPLIDLLQQPGNYTAFVPNDRAVSKALRRFKTYAKRNHIKLNGPLPAANTTWYNVSFADLITYHVAPTKFALSSLPSNVNIVHSALNKPELDKVGTGLPLLIESNATTAQLSNQSWVAEEGQYQEYEVGSGVMGGDVQKKDIEASNGYLNIIDQFLAPPMAPSLVLAEDDDLSTLLSILKTYPALAQTLDGLTNVTVFAPNNDAFSQISLDGLTEQDVTSIILAHIVPNIYYSPDVAAAAASNNSMVTVTSSNNTDINIMVNATSGAITLNNNINVEDANIFFNNGVMHVIDQVILNTPAM